MIVRGVLLVEWKFTVVECKCKLGHGETVIWSTEVLLHVCVMLKFHQQYQTICELWVEDFLIKVFYEKI